MSNHRLGTSRNCFVLSLVFLLTVLLTCLAPGLMAQTAGTGALIGTVTDSTGAVVPGVTITAISADTGQIRTATTGADGTYTVSLLPPGNYRVRFEHAGFNTVEVPSATVNVTETSVLDRVLQVGSQAQEVTVQGDVETIQTASSALGTVVSTRTVTELPLNTRNYTNLLAMTAGANSSVNNASTIGKGSSFIAVNGGGTAQNTYLQDGVTINNWYSFNTGTEGVAFGSFAIPNPDAISEFKIQTSTYDAGYGRGPGANVNVITKTGTNSFHGTAFEFFRNTVLNANDWIYKYNEGTHVPALPNDRPVLNSNVYGGVFGGPIKKDKLFFFVSYQESNQKNGLSGYGLSNVTLPPIPTGNRGTCPVGWSSLSQCDAAGQAFVPALASAISPLGACAHTANPNNTSVVGGGTGTSNIQVQCPGSPNTNALFNINPVAINILQLKLANGNYLIPSSGASLGNGAAGYLPQTYSDPAIFKDHNGMGNFDWTINAQNTLSGRYQYERDPLQAPFPVLNANLAGNFLPGNPITTIKWNHAAMLKLTSLVSSNFVNEVHAAYQRNNVEDTIGSPFKNSQVGIADLQPGTDYLSFITIGSGTAGLFSFGGQYQFGGTFVDNQYLIGDQISWTHGKHTIRAGFEKESIKFIQVYFGRSIGNPTFPRFADFLIGRAACNFAGCSSSNPGNTNGSASASNISTVGNFTSANAGVPFHYHALELSGFVQDDFKFNSRLTLNLGLRWEYDGYPTEEHGLFSNVFPSILSSVPLPGSTPATGTLAGFSVPSNYSGLFPAGLSRENNNGPALSGAPRDDFAPRIGFAWQPTSSGRWVVRGGAGYFYDLISGSTFLGLTGISTPALGQPQISGAAGATLAVPWVIPQGVVSAGPGLFGFSPRWVATGNLTTTGITGSNLTAQSIQQNITVPLTYEWNLNTQYEFLPTWVLELGYVGSHGIHQAAQSRSGAQGQASTITGLNLAPLVDASCASCQLTHVTTNTVQNVLLRVPELGISAQNPVLATLESYKYNSLQATVRKQLSHGVQLQVAYTWSRAFITEPFGINSAPYLIHKYELNNNYRPHRFVLNYVWNLPLGRHDGLLGKATDGWALSGVTTIQDGSPMTILDNGGSIFFGGSGAISTAQLCPGMTNGNLLTSGSIQQRVVSGLTGGAGYLNGKTQGVLCNTPTISNGTGFGNLGGGVVLGPGQSNWDMSLAKTTSIHESQSVQFRAEFFNTFNHPQFANPGTNVAVAGYGQITGTSVSPRIIQLALKYSF